MFRFSALIPVVALVLSHCAPADESFRALAVGDPAPAFTAPSSAGDTVRLADLRGQVVLLNVWATWCPPCREEMPGLQALHERYVSRGLRVLGVTIDSPGAGPAVRRFVTDYGITFDILHDPDDTVSRQFRTLGVPETFLIDADGHILHRWIGKFDPLAADVTRLVESALP